MIDEAKRELTVELGKMVCARRNIKEMTYPAGVDPRDIGHEFTFNGPSGGLLEDVSKIQIPLDFSGLSIWTQGSLGNERLNSLCAGRGWIRVIVDEPTFKMLRHILHSESSCVVLANKPSENGG